MPTRRELVQVQPVVGERPGDVRGRRPGDEQPARPVGPHRPAAPGQHPRGLVGPLDADPGLPCAGRREQVRHPAAGDEAALRHDRHRVRDLLHLGEDVAGHQHGLPGRGEVAHRLPHLVDARGVEAVRRLVEDHQLGVLEQRGRDRQPLLHAEGVGAEGAGRPVGEADVGEHPVHPGGGRPDPGGEQLEVPPPGERREEPRRLDDRPDPGDDLGQRVGDRAVEHAHDTRVGADEPEQHPDRRRLARAVRAQEPVHAAERHVQVQAAHGDDLAAAVPVGLPQAAGADGGGPRRRRLRRHARPPVASGHLSGAPTRP